MDSSKDSHSKYCLSRRASWRYISSAPRMVAILSQREDSLDALEKKNSDRRDHKDLITDQVQEYRRKPCTHRLVLLEPYGSTTRIEATLNALHMILRGEVAQYNTTMPPMAQQATTMSVVRQEFSERPDLDAFIPPEQLVSSLGHRASSMLSPDPLVPTAPSNPVATSPEGVRQKALQALPMHRSDGLESKFLMLDRPERLPEQHMLDASWKPDLHGRNAR